MNDRLKKLQAANNMLLHSQHSDASSHDSQPERCSSEDFTTNEGSFGQPPSRHSMVSDFNQTGQSFSGSRERIKNPTLAQSLRQRREFHEAIESERQAHGVMK